MSTLSGAGLQIRPGVAAVVKDGEGRVLLHQRAIGGGWAPASGSVEPGESIADALSRELWEEARLEVEVLRLVGVYSNPSLQVITYPDGRRLHFVT